MALGLGCERFGAGAEANRSSSSPKRLALELGAALGAGLAVGANKSSSPPNNPSPVTSIVDLRAGRLAAGVVGFGLTRGDAEIEVTPLNRSPLDALSSNLEDCVGVEERTGIVTFIRDDSSSPSPKRESEAGAC